MSVWHKIFLCHFALKEIKINYACTINNQKAAVARPILIFYLCFVIATQCMLLYPIPCGIILRKAFNHWIERGSLIFQCVSLRNCGTPAYNVRCIINMYKCVIKASMLHVECTCNLTNSLRWVPSSNCSWHYITVQL